MSSSCSTSATSRVNLVIDPVLVMNKESTGKCLRQVEHIRGHLWHIYSIAVNQVMKKGIREREREVGGDGVSGCSFGQPLKQETFQTSLYIQTRA